MDIILCHQTADFDALGAAVGLSQLLPGSRIVLTGGAHPTVREFLALYRNELPLIELRSVIPHRIRSLHIVDNQYGDRLGKAAAWLTLPQLQEIVVYDHHLNAKSDIPATTTEIAAIGATTTLITEKLQTASIQLTPVQASVMSLGIHVDTGSLTFGQTSVRDVKALAWLLEQGASLQIIAAYVDPSFSPAIQTLFATAMQSLKKERVAGYQVGKVLLQSASFVPGLSNLAERLVSLTDCNALLLGHVYGKGNLEDKENQRFTIIGRTRIPQTDLTHLLHPLGGGGHGEAASVNLRNVQPQALLDDLYAQFKAQIPQPLLARDLMSSPVRTIRPETTIQQAQRVLFRYGHSGLTVVDDQEQLVGIISRRDLDLALHHGFSHAPVKGYMTRQVKTITPSTPLPEIEAIMVADDVGRLPVMTQGELRGIVTRTDVLRQLLQERSELESPMVHDSAVEDSPGEITLPQPEQLLSLLQTHLQPATWQLLTQAAEQAEKRGWHLYLVGGAIRDLLLHACKHIWLQDIDLVVDGFQQTVGVGSGVTLAEALQQNYPDARLSVHGEFQTAALLWHRSEALDSLWVDIATARTEFYPYPAANPQVEASSIRQDLYRRDFTINALAVRLTHPRRGELLDFFGGMVDLRQQQVRVLHANSFIEDPTRIYRAVRFVVRLGFQLESQTEAYIRYAIASGVYERLRLTGKPAPALTTRLKAEFSIILKAAYWQTALTLLSDLGALKCLHPDLKLTTSLRWRLRYLSRWLKCLDPGHHLDHWLLRLALLITAIAPEERATVAQNLQLPKILIDCLEQLEPAETAIATTLLERHCSPSQVYQCLASYSTTLLYLVSARASRSVRRHVWQYFTCYSRVAPLLSGHDLKQLGYKPSAQFKEILTEIKYQTLDGKLTNKTMALHWVKKHY